MIRQRLSDVLGRRPPWALLVAAALAAACSAPPEGPPPVPRVTLVTDFDPAIVGPALLALRTGTPPLEVELVSGSAPTAGADVFWSKAPAPALALARAGKTLAHTPTTLPAVRDAAGTWNGAAGVGWVLLINKTLLPPGFVPNSVEELTNPRFRGFISLVPADHALVRDYRAALTEVWGAEQARILVDLMARNDARIFPTLPFTAGMVAAGRVMFTLVDSGTAENFLRVNDKLEMVVPDQDSMGVLLVPSVVVLLAGAPHVEAGRALVDRLVAMPIAGRIVPTPTLKVMAADVTRFEPPIAASPIGPEGLPISDAPLEVPEGAAPDSAPASAPSASPAAPSTRPSGRGRAKAPASANAAASGR